jgi:leucyl-tRNA synthetase
MAQYNFTDIEKKWQSQWAQSELYKVTETTHKPKFYALDMFPYPSGAGLHVGHPLGYIASDIVSRYKRLNGYNVLHPMGYDAFGLPAEQYAIQTGQHPAITTEQNIARFKEQLDRIGFSFDWSRAVKTCDEGYYKWTQWIFSRLFEHYYDGVAKKAMLIENLVAEFALNGNVNKTLERFEEQLFTADEWATFSAKEKEAILNTYRLAFVDETTVNWCEEMGTVLANEEVVNGVSERGGYPVIRKRMKQWSLRITAYADRLLDGLNNLDWTDSIKEIQRNWIGRSEGAEINFSAVNKDLDLKVFTTRPDTIFGATFMVIAPEFEGIETLCSSEQLVEVNTYVAAAKNRSEIERMANTKKTGVDTGCRVINPFTQAEMPVWVSDYVLAGYGTGCIMAVPAHDERDFEFAQKFSLTILPVIKPLNGELDLPLKEAFVSKDGICINSDFLDGLTVKEAIKVAITHVKEHELGHTKINYKLRDAGFGRQRYWGEPIPIIYNEQGLPSLDKNLPLVLPKVESYKPAGTGESPLAAVTDWVNTPYGTRETDTMPGWAGSSWYFLRYMDPNNDEAIASPELLKYWNQVDLYVGGSEHATGHLLYSRFWTKFLYDIGVISWDEPFKKLVNQGMIGGEDGQKMSKRWGNVVNPDDVCAQYGADTLRLYEMFLGPLTDSKPWNTQGIEGVSRFLGKFWRLFHDNDDFLLSQEEPTKDELKILHKTIKKVSHDIDNMSFNTSVSAFMVATNELGALKCNKRSVLEPLVIILAPFAPHITEELWALLGHTNSVHTSEWPVHNEEYLVENSFSYPVSINGKTRTSMEFALDTDRGLMEKEILANDIVQKWLEGKSPKKVIIVPGRIVNIVV